MSKAEEYIKAYTRGCSNELVGGGHHEWLTPENALAAVELAREEMRTKQIAVIKCEKKSPITGGEMQLMQEKSSVKFRGEEVFFIKKFYHCVDSGQDFTDTELDNDNMWAIFRAYWERKGFEHFYDIDGYRKEQEPESEDLKEEIKRFYNFKDDAQITNNFNGLMKFAKHIIQWHSERIVVNKILDTRIDDKNFEREVEQTIKAQDLLNMLPHTLIKYTAQHFINWQRKQMMKDAAEGQFDYNHIIVPYSELARVFPNGKDGDKVKVIIIKE